VNFHVIERLHAETMKLGDKSLIVFIDHEEVFGGYVEEVDAIEAIIEHFDVETVLSSRTLQNTRKGKRAFDWESADFANLATRLFSLEDEKVLAVNADEEPAVVFLLSKDDFVHFEFFEQQVNSSLLHSRLYSFRQCGLS
jgi:hypothetical protein